MRRLLVVRQEICSVKPGVFVQPTLRSSSSVKFPYVPRCLELVEGI
jgi:hypothetical protein